MRVGGWTGAVVLLAAAAAGCASLGGDPAPPEVPGCYQFESTADARALGLPWGMDLFDIPLEGATPEGEPTRYEARTRLGPDRTADHPFRVWWRTAGDSIRVGYPGRGGFVLSVVFQDRALVGTGRAVGDAVAPGESVTPPEPRPVTAHKVVCPPPRD